ncbi:MAG: hypothetical protein AAFZ52_00855, partial [Bacteroidota bacterium]
MLSRILLSLLLLPYLVVVAQIEYRPATSETVLDSWRWTSLTDLENEQVRCMTQTSQGKMLFGARRGIINYDGYAWSYLDKPDSLRRHDLTCLLPLPDDRLLAGTNRGVFQVDSTGWYPLVPELSQHLLEIRDMVHVPNYGIAVSCPWGLLLLNEREIVVHVSESTARNLQIGDGRPVSVRVLPREATLLDAAGESVVSGNDLLANDDGSIYLALGHPVANGKILHLTPDPTSQHSAFTLGAIHGPKTGLFVRSNVNMGRGPNGELWAVSNGYEYGLYRFDGSTWREEKLSERFGGVDSQSHLLVCSDGSVWVDGHG